MTKRKLHVGTSRDWRRILKKYSPRTIKKVKKLLGFSMEEGSLSAVCPFNPLRSTCNICHMVFPETKSNLECSCSMFYKNEIKTFVESILKEK